MKTIDDLFLHFLQDIYYAERQLLKALPKMAKAAETPALKEAFTQHREETIHQIERLEQVFEQIGRRPRGIPCEAIKGLIEEAEEVINDCEAGDVRDAGLAACGQAVEHYEMARYGALIAWAEVMGQPDVTTRLRETLQEERQADTLLGKLATGQLNQQAATHHRARAA